MKKKDKTLPQLKNELQTVFNEFIRLRDSEKPCISCGEFKPLQAGHFFAVKGYDALRFNEDNVHGECAGCNCFNESHLIYYHDRLIERIGQERVDELKLCAETYKRLGYKWSKSELKELIIEYKERVKQLKQR